MKSIIEQMNIKYDNISANFNKFEGFCHSMNVNNYKIKYKDFFNNKGNILLEKKLAEQDMSLESENIFVDWLNME